MHACVFVCQVVHKKTATALAITSLKAEDTNALQKLTTAVRADFNDRHDEVRVLFCFFIYYYYYYYYYY